MMEKIKENVEETESRKFHIGHRHILGKYGVSRKKMVFTCFVGSTSLAIFLCSSIVFLGLLYGTLTALIVWLIMASAILEMFLISVPKIAGLVTTNLLNGYMESYGTGLHFKYPWEQVENDHYISIRLVAEDYIEDFPASDGPKVTSKWTIQYRPIVEKLFMYIAVDETRIRDGFKAIGNSYLSDKISIETAKRAREKVIELQDGMKTLFEKTQVEIRETEKRMFRAKIKELNKKIKIFEQAEKSVGEEERSVILKDKIEAKRVLKISKDKLGEIERRIKGYLQEKKEREKKGINIKTLDECILEEEYGIDLVVVSLADTNFEKRYQDIRATDKMSQEMDEMVDRMIEKSKQQGEKLTRKQALNLILVLNKSASKEIIEVEGEGGDAIASLLGMFRKGRSE